MLGAMTANPARRSAWVRRAAMSVIILACADVALAGVFHAWSVASPSAPAARPVVAVLYADTPPALDRTRRALDRAVELHRAGGVKRIVCLGGNRPGIAWHAGDAMRAHLIAGGIPGERVVAERASYDTRTNLGSLGTLLHTWGENEVLVVAYPVHQWRIRHYAAMMPEGAVVEFAAPRLGYSWSGFADTWTALHHEAAAWTLTVVLSDRAYERLVRHLRASS